MIVITPSLNLHGFLKRIPLVRERVLMLDYDGTLAPFQVRRERASSAKRQASRCIGGVCQCCISRESANRLR